MTALALFAALAVIYLACGRFYEGRPAQRVEPQLDGTYTLITCTGRKVSGFATCTAAMRHAEEIK